MIRIEITQPVWFEPIGRYFNRKKRTRRIRKQWKRQQRQDLDELIRRVRDIMDDPINKAA